MLFLGADLHRSSSTDSTAMIDATPDAFEALVAGDSGRYSRDVSPLTSPFASPQPSRAISPSSGLSDSSSGSLQSDEQGRKVASPGSNVETGWRRKSPGNIMIESPSLPPGGTLRARPVSPRGDDTAAPAAVLPAAAGVPEGRTAISSHSPMRELPLSSPRQLHFDEQFPVYDDAGLQSALGSGDVTVAAELGKATLSEQDPLLDDTMPTVTGEQLHSVPILFSVRACCCLPRHSVRLCGQASVPSAPGFC